MGLVRAFSDLGQVIIRKLGDVGGPRADRTSAEFDNIINWSKSAIRNIGTDTSTVGNVGVGLDNLHSFSLDTPNRLNTNGDYLRATSQGIFARNDNDKRLVVKFDSQTIMDSGLRDVDGSTIGLRWAIVTTILRLTSTTVRAFSVATAQFFGADSAGAAYTLDTAGGYLLVQGGDLTVANMNNNALTFLVQAEGTANDDIQQTFSIFELRQQ